MSGLQRPAVNAPVAVAPPPAPRPAAPSGPAPTATLRPAGSVIAPAAVATGLPEPVASALRQHLSRGDVTSAQVSGAGVRVTPHAAVEPSRPAAVTLAPHEGGDTVRLEAHVSEVKSHAGDAHPGVRPKGLSAARTRADDLILIKGVGPANEKILHGLGIYHFDQIAHWTAQEAEWTGHHMRFPGRIEREHWIEQCKLLAAGGDTAHSLAVKSGKLRRDEIGRAHV